jgi:NAD(P)-dependent dehydrogenase (short-subunit alcohol dehydrogenase family)
VKEIQGLGQKAFAFTADVSNLKEVEELVKASVSELGPLNTMIANAGIAQVKALLDLTEHDLRRMFEVNGIVDKRSQFLSSDSHSIRRVQLLFYRGETDDIPGQRRQNPRRGLHRGIQAFPAPLAL